ncbi:disks large homolog 3-like isoform X3 [Cynoglossus semilaevis]|uniref:disks large homolog 3-like isoform X3 n=1 Tax=Cynoglossus semilaevis TaxID=244447 RepID=UPI000D6282DF|nr:disks large homolog 3-like isoform X3 [Cynoglossus semilaevis]
MNSKNICEMSSEHKDGADQLSGRGFSARRHKRGETEMSGNCQYPGALHAGPCLHGDPDHNKKPSFLTEHLTSPATEKPLHHAPFISHQLLKLQIRVSGQKASLGISIAGGKGSLPYKDHDEGIFISRVRKGGPSEKAGIHVGDRLLEVNGLSMLGATHHEAVSTLRNAGSCIKMKVLRERMMLPTDEPQDPGDMIDGVDLPQLCGVQRSKQSRVDAAPDCLPRKIEAVLCNGSSTIPRIILTHPSVSDEDVELLTQSSSSRELPHNSDIPDRHVNPDCFDCAFYPP